MNPKPQQATQLQTLIKPSNTLITGALTKSKIAGMGLSLAD
jgi:hypothetical protein